MLPRLQLVPRSKRVPVPALVARSKRVPVPASVPASLPGSSGCLGVQALHRLTLTLKTKLFTGGRSREGLHSAEGSWSPASAPAMARRASASKLLMSEEE